MRWSREASQRTVANEDIVPTVIPESNEYTFVLEGFHIYGVNSTYGMNYDVCLYVLLLSPLIGSGDRGYIHIDDPHSQELALGSSMPRWHEFDGSLLLLHVGRRVWKWIVEV
jgi:hypothetical protein